MFSKKELVACCIYSFDYSKESLELNELVFRSVPVKKRWRKYFLLSLSDCEDFSLSVSKNDLEKVLNKGSYHVVFFENHSRQNSFKAWRLFNKYYRMRNPDV